MTVAQLVDRVTVHELQDWQAFYNQHPFPADLIDIQGAQLASILANVNRPQSTAAFVAAEFMVLRQRRPAAPPPPPRITEAQRIRAFFQANGGG